MTLDISSRENSLRDANLVVTTGQLGGLRGGGRGGGRTGWGFAVDMKEKEEGGKGRGDSRAAEEPTSGDAGRGWPREKRLSVLVVAVCHGDSAAVQ